MVAAIFIFRWAPPLQVALYFDRYPQKIQHFQGVTVYTPSNILNQSHVVMMFQSGAGVEVIENKQYMAARVFLPWEFIVSLRFHLLWLELISSSASQNKIMEIQEYGFDNFKFNCENTKKV